MANGKPVIEFLDALSPDEEAHYFEMVRKRMRGELADEHWQAFLSSIENLRGLNSKSSEASG